MNPTIITAKISDQHLQLVNETLIASGGVDVLQIRFEFCGLWDGCGRTAVFYRDPATVYHVPVVDCLVTVPHEMLADEGFFYFGVMGTADNVRTTEVVKVKVVRGAITSSTATPEDPAPDIYDQLIAAYGRIEKKVDEVQIYVGSGEMPEEYNLQIDPDGEVFEMDTVLDENSRNPVENRVIAGKINALSMHQATIMNGLQSMGNRVTAIENDVEGIVPFFTHSCNLFAGSTYLKPGDAIVVKNYNKIRALAFGVSPLATATEVMDGQRSTSILTYGVPIAGSGDLEYKGSYTHLASIDGVIGIVTLIARGVATDEGYKIVIEACDETKLDVTTGESTFTDWYVSNVYDADAPINASREYTGVDTVVS